MSTAAAQPDLAPPRPKKKHWGRRILLTLVSLVLVLAATVQIILWTDLPRNIVVAQLEKQLGLRLTVKSLSTGWLGNTQLNDVTISLPLADKAFLEVPEMKVKNTSLFGLMLGRPVEVEEIELDRPQVHVWQQPDGSWNLGEVAQLLAHAGGQKTGEESAKSSSSPKLPNVRVIDGVVSITDKSGQTVEIAPLSVNGYRDTGVSWKYDVQIPPRVSIVGRLVPGGNWEHEVAIKIQDVGAWARTWSPGFPEVGIDATWHGALAEAGVSGRLDVRRISLGDGENSAGLTGGLAVSAGGETITLRPDNLMVSAGSGPLAPLKLASGIITYTTASKDVKIEKLLVGLLGGIARVSADCNLNAMTGRLDAGWENLSLPGGTSQSGAFTATMQQPFPDRIVIDSHLQSAGTQAASTWEGSIGLGITGKSFSDFDWKVNVERLKWQRHDLGIKLDGLAMTGQLRNQVFALATIAMPDCDLIAGSASYDFRGLHPWQLHLQGQHWPLPPVQGTELAFNLGAHGDAANAILDSAVFKTPDAELDASAKYVFDTPRPLTVELAIHNAAEKEPPLAVASSKAAKILHGAIDGHFSLAGTFDPLELDAGGYLDGREIDVRGHHLGNFHVALSGQSHVNSEGVVVYTDSLSLFQGHCGIMSVFDFATAKLKVDLDLDQISLKEVATVAGRDDIAGTLRGHIRAILPWFTPDLDHLEIPPATMTLQNVTACGFACDQISATVSLSEGYLQLNPILLNRGKGTGAMRVAMNVDDLHRIGLAAKIDSWPLDMPGAPAHVDGSLDLDEAVIELPDETSLDPAKHALRIAARQINLHGVASFKGDKLGDFIAYAGVNGREIDLRAFHLRLLDGRLDGQAHTDLDHLLKSTAEFTWEKLDLKKLALIFPQLHDFSGKLSGDVRIAPTTVPRALEPLAVVVTAEFEKGLWRADPRVPGSGVPLQDARVAAYFGQTNQAEQEGWRIVLDDNRADPCYLRLAGGEVLFWGRFGFHQDASSSQAQLTLRNIDMNQVIRALEPESSDMPGKISGSIMVIRSPVPASPAPVTDPERMFPGRIVAPVTMSVVPDPAHPLKGLLYPIYAEGNLELTHADLLDFGPFAFAYNTARLFVNSKKAEGDGNVEFHLERGKLMVDHMRYFNRGTELRAVAVVDEVWKIPDSPVEATISVIAQPLHGAKLPIFADLNTALTAIQQSLQLTAVRVTGTLHKPIPAHLSLSELGEGMRKFIVGDAKSK